MDYLYSGDADFACIDFVPPQEVLGTLVGTIHPGYNHKL